MAEHSPCAENVIVLALYDVMEENAKQNKGYIIDPLDADNAAKVILRALEKLGLFIVEAEEPC